MVVLRLRVQPFMSSRLQRGLLLLAVLLQFLAFNFYRGHLPDAALSLTPQSVAAHSFYLHSSDTDVINHDDRIFSSSPGKIIRSTRHQASTTTSSRSGHLPPRTIYLELAWTDLHLEIFYSLIQEFCGTFPKDLVFRADENVAFYLGPADKITSSAVEIWREFNESEASCGPIHIDVPANPPDLTVLTTTYAHPTYTHEFIAQHVNNSKFLIICHDDNQEMENTSNVYWLTPFHSNYFIPNFFPPSFVARRKQRLLQQRRGEGKFTRGPVFLVMGKATPRKRNVRSLIEVLRHYQHEKFRVRIMGKHFPPAFNKSMYCKEAWCDKIEYIRLPNPLDFMLNVTAVDVILPLVDETCFFTTYQGGKKLSSSVMWGQAFDIPMVLYRELAYVYNVRNDSCIYDEHPSRIHLAPNVTHWPSRSRSTTTSESSSRNLRTFISCFGEVLEQFKQSN